MLTRLSIVSAATAILAVGMLLAAASGCGSDSSVSVYLPRTGTPSAASPTGVAPTATASAAAPTRTATGPITATAAPVDTATSTPPPTRTATVTPPPATNTAVPTATRTALATATVAPTSTATTAVTATASATASATVPPATATNTTAATATVTPLAAATPSATGLPTSTAPTTATSTATTAVIPTATRTFTATTLPAATFTPTALPTMEGGATCGDRLLEQDETCESCAADCVVGPCNAPGAPTQAYIVDLIPPLGFQPTTATVLLAYDSSKLSLPGTGTATTVRQHVVAGAPVPQAFTPNDLDYAVRVLESRNIPLGTLFTATFDRCAGAPAPTLDDVACTVSSCAAGGTGVPGCTCSVRLP